MNTEPRRLWIPQAVVIGMLLFALRENPYGYYQLMRWVVCAVFAFLAYRAIDTSQQDAVPWIFGAVAILYNPIIPIHLNREIWSFLNIGTAGIAVAAILLDKPKRPESPSEPRPEEPAP